MRSVNKLILVTAASLSLGLYGGGSDSSSSGTTGTTGTGGGTATGTTGGTTDAGTTGGTTDAGTTGGTDDAGTTGGTTGGTDDAGTTGGTTSDGGTTTGGTTDAGTTGGTTDAGTTGGTTDAGTTGGTTGPACETPPTVFSEQVSHLVALTLLQPDGSTGALDCDANNDGKVDAADASFNDFLLNNALASSLKVNEQFKTNVEDGSLIFLLEAMGWDGGAAANDVTINLYAGADLDKQSDPTCGQGAKLNEPCSWLVDADSFDAQCKPLVSFTGAKVDAGVASGGPTDITFTFNLAGASLGLNLKTAAFKANVTAGFDATSGRICGSVGKQEIIDALKTACEGDNAPSFCSLVIPALPILQGQIACDPCTLTVGFESKTGKITGVEAPPAP